MRLGKIYALFGAYLIVTIGSTSTMAEQPKPQSWHHNLQNAWKVAQKNKRPMLLFISSRNCPYCQKMERSTLQNRDVRVTIGSNFVAAVIDAARDQKVVRQLGVKIYPTTVIVNQRGELVTSITGYMDADRYQQQLAKAVKQQSAKVRSALKTPLSDIAR